MILSYKGIIPAIHESVFIASGAVITGDVRIDRDSGVWFNTVIRGDVNYVRIGCRTNIQDNSVLHVTNGRQPLTIGNDVTIGHNSVVHGCKVHDRVLIGMGAILLDNSEVHSDTVIAAGSLVKEGDVIPPGVLAAGIPAKIKRDLRKEEIEKILESAAGYAGYAMEYKKNVRLIRTDDY